MTSLESLQVFEDRTKKYKIVVDCDTVAEDSYRLNNTNAMRMDAGYLYWRNEFLKLIDETLVVLFSFGNKVDICRLVTWREACLFIIAEMVKDHGTSLHEEDLPFSTATTKYVRKLICVTEELPNGLEISVSEGTIIRRDCGRGLSLRLMDAEPRKVSKQLLKSKRKCFYGGISVTDEPSFRPFYETVSKTFQSDIHDLLLT